MMHNCNVLNRKEPVAMRSIERTTFLSFILATFLSLWVDHGCLAQTDQIQVIRSDMAIIVAQENWLALDLSIDKVDEMYVLTGQEREWLLLLKSDFEGFFHSLAFNEAFYEGIRMHRVISMDYSMKMYEVAEYLSLYDSLGIVLDDKFTAYIPKVAERVQESELVAEQKDFIQLYLLYYQFQMNVCDTDRVNIVSKAFASASFENSTFTDFVIKYESTIAQPANKSMQFGMGLGAHQIMQNAQNISTGFMMNFLYEFHFQWFFLGSRMQINQHRTMTSFLSHPQYEQGRPLGLFYFDVLAGVSKSFMEVRWMAQAYLGYGFGFFRGISEVNEPNFSTTQVNSGFLGAKAQYAFNKTPICDNRSEFFNQRFVAVFLDVSLRMRPFGSSFPEISGPGLMLNVGVVFNNPLLRKVKH